MRTSLTSFIDFNVTAGPSRTKIPAQCREMQEDPNRHPWEYYEPMIDAIVDGFADPVTLERGVEAAVRMSAQRSTEKRFRGQDRHFRQLAEGAIKLRQVLPVRTVGRAPTGLWSHENLEIRVSPHMLIERVGGRREVCFLYVKERALEQATADTALVILTDVLAEKGMAEVLARVVDVRRGATYALTRNRAVKPLRYHAIGEAELFARFWDLAAA